MHSCRCGAVYIAFGRVSGDAADVGLLALRQVLIHERKDFLDRLDSVALRHAVVEEDELIGDALSFEALLDQVKGVVGARRYVGVDAEPVEHALDRKRVEVVVVDDQHFDS